MCIWHRLFFIGLIQEKMYEILFIGLMIIGFIAITHYLSKHFIVNKLTMRKVFHILAVMIFTLPAVNDPRFLVTCFSGALG